MHTTGRGEGRCLRQSYPRAAKVNIAFTSWNSGTRCFPPDFSESSEQLAGSFSSSAAPCLQDFHIVISKVFIRCSNWASTLDMHQV